MKLFGAVGHARMGRLWLFVRGGKHWMVFGIAIIVCFGAQNASSAVPLQEAEVLEDATHRLLEIHEDPGIWEAREVVIEGVVAAVVFEDPIDEPVAPRSIYYLRTPASDGIMVVGEAPIEGVADLLRVTGRVLVDDAGRAYLMEEDRVVLGPAPEQEGGERPGRAAGPTWGWAVLGIAVGGIVPLILRIRE